MASQPHSGPLILNRFSFREEIAQGSTASVWRAKAIDDGSLVAIKIVELDFQDPSQQVRAKQVVREVRIHETLKHQAVLSLIGGETRIRQGQWPGGLYMALELAAGGDLFDKIAPDVGVPENVAHLYLNQLIAGLKYVATLGICHRDIKPENVLVDGSGDLKIADFGLATVYKYKGQTRKLNDRCGSPPYAAPELAIPAPYEGEPIDVWSAGIVFFALLVGNTPWDEPTTNSPEYRLFLSGEIWREEPWNRIKEGAVRNLLQRMLEVNPAKRITLDQIAQNDWFTMENSFLGKDGQCTDGAQVAGILMGELQNQGMLGAPSAAFEEVVAASQQGGLMATQPLFSQRGLPAQTAFRGTMQLYSQVSMAPSQRSKPGTLRFFTTRSLDSIVTLLTSLLTSYHSRPIRVAVVTPPDQSSGLRRRIQLATTDDRRMELKAAIDVSDDVLSGEGYMNGGGGGMEVDGGGSGEGGTRGLVVAASRKTGNPLELTRLWHEVVMARLGEGVVFAA